MSLFKKISSLGVAGFLTACGTVQTEAPTVSGTAANIGGVYSTTQNGTTRLLQAPAGMSAGTGLIYWFNPSEKAFMYEGANVIAIAGMDVTSNETFAGISGVAATGVPTSGAGVYTGDFSATYFRGGATNAPWNAKGAFNTVVDFGSGKIRGMGAGTYDSILFIDGAITGTEFSGSAEFSALEYTGAGTVPMTGGLYGFLTANIAGIYQGDAVAGVFWGQ